MRILPLALAYAGLVFPTTYTVWAQSPTLAPVNPKTEALWAKPPFGADGLALRTALSNSCDIFFKRPADKPVSVEAKFGTNGQWQQFCDTALSQPADKLEQYMMENLESITLDTDGKFTGYYKPVVEGSLKRHGAYQTPMLAKPDDLVDCGGATGQRLPGGGCRAPYPTRAEIEKNIEKYKVLLWLKDPVDAYFIHIQGSALVELDTGDSAYLQFAAKNGHPYVAIGKVLKEMGELRGNITAQKIRDWLHINPTRTNEILHKNNSFIFFRKGAGDHAIGALGVPLTAGRSLAVDRKYIPLGLPVVVKTTSTHDGQPWERVMLAQDIGSAITGAGRGDIFFGLGHYAGDYAGDQNAQGQLQVLVPKTVGAQIEPVPPLAVVTPTIVISGSVVSLNGNVSETALIAAAEAGEPAVAAIEPAAGPVEATTPETADLGEALKSVAGFVAAHVDVTAPNPIDTGL